MEEEPKRKKKLASKGPSPETHDNGAVVCLGLAVALLLLPTAGPCEPESSGERCSRGSLAFLIHLLEHGQSSGPERQRLVQLPLAKLSVRHRVYACGLPEL